jgi:hypothetical protein
MKIIVLWSLKESIDQAKLVEALSRRAEFHPPAGTELLAEYWTACKSPAVISLFETDDAASLMANTVTWLDIFTADVFPVTPWEEGLEKLSRHMVGMAAVPA